MLIPQHMVQIWVKDTIPNTLFFTNDIGSDTEIGGQGTQGTIGVQGIQGLQGILGIQGVDGTFGGATFDYTFDTSTTGADPGTGKIRFK